MIIDAQNKSKKKKNGFAGNHGYNLKSLSTITRWIRYTISPSVVDGKDTHYGVQYSKTNIPTDILHPAIEDKLRPFKNDEARKGHELKYAASQAEFIMNHNNESRANSKKDNAGKEDLFRFIISCSDKETAGLTEQQKVDFLHDVGERILRRMSKSKDINFYYRADIHLKDGNPHLHMSVGHFDKDGNYHKFFIGKKYEGGMLDLFQEVKYECEKYYPFLEQMETKLRDQEITEKDNNLVSLLTTIESEFDNEKYNYTKADAAIKASGLLVKYHRVRGICKDIFLVDNANPERMVSYKKLPLPLKQLLEKNEYFNIKKSKHGVDLSANIPTAFKLIQENKDSNLTDLNNLLALQGLKLYPTRIKNNVQWSLYFTDYAEKISITKIGINPKSEEFKNLFDIESDLLEKLLNEKTKLQRTELTISAEYQNVKRTYQKQAYEPYSEFRYQTNESTEQFLNRMKLAHHSKKMLTNQIAQGSSVISKFNSKEMFRRLDAHEYQLLQSNASSVKTLIQEIVARGDNTIEFTGPANAKMQEALYLEAMLNGLTVKNYTPTFVVAEKLKELQEAHYTIAMQKNIDKIEAAIANPPAKPVKLVHTRQLDRTIDSKPAYQSMLYALHRAPQPELWAMPHDLKPMSNADLEDVAKRAQAQLQIDRKRLTDLFNMAGFPLPALLAPVEVATPDHSPTTTQEPKPSAPAKAEIKPEDVKKKTSKQEVNRNRIKPD